VVLLVSVVIGLAATTIRAKATGRKLRPIELKRSWLVLLAVSPQIIAFQVPVIGRKVPESLIPVLLIATQLLLLWFTFDNLVKPGIWALGIGLVTNFIAIASNGGWMPISPETVHKILPTIPEGVWLVGHRLGLSKDWILPTQDIKMYWFSDRFTLPVWIPYRVAFSLGDIFIALGAFLLVWSLSNPEKKETK
jgi:hypothetical protein